MQAPETIADICPENAGTQMLVFAKHGAVLEEAYPWPALGCGHVAEGQEKLPYGLP